MHLPIFFREMSKKRNTFWGHDELPITSFLENKSLFLVWLLVKESLYLGEKVYLIMEKQHKFYLELNFKIRTLINSLSIFGKVNETFCLVISK